MYACGLFFLEEKRRAGTRQLQAAFCGSPRPLPTLLINRTVAVSVVTAAFLPHFPNAVDANTTDVLDL